MSTTAAVLEDTSTTGSFMLPGMGSPEEISCSRVVRFHNECVLIPKATVRPKLPVVLTKSYSLPLWKRKTPQFSDSDVEDAAGSLTPLQSSEDKRVTIKVPIPTFGRRSRSPTPRSRSISSSPTTPKSLPSCLVYRAPSESAASSVKPIPIRRPSPPIHHRRQDELTVPLRDCCADCQQITEQCLKEGNDWKEKFSRGARRRRSASLDYSTSTPASSDTRNANLTRAFTPFSSEGRASKDLNPRFSTVTNAFSITVDEVDKRRKIFDYSMEDTDFIRSLSPPPSPSSSQQSHSSASPFASSSGNSLYPRVKPRDREASSNSTVSSMSTTDDLFPGPDILDSRNRLRSSPIEEEDETQLFPLPRRSRSNTPSPVPSLLKATPPPSPNLNGSFSSSYISSKWNSSSSQESILRNSLSHKFEDEQVEERAPTRLVSDTENKPLSTNIPHEISDLNTISLRAPSNSPSTDNILPSSNFSKPETAATLPEQATDTNPKPPPSAYSPSLNTKRPSQRKRKLSFTLPFIKAGEAIRDVGADVLRGVSSLSNSGGVVGSF